MALGMCDVTRRKIWHKSGEEQCITTNRCKHSAAQLTTRRTATFWHARGGSRNYLDKTLNQAFFNQTVMSSAVIIKGIATHVKHELILRSWPRACKHKPVWFGCQDRCIFFHSTAWTCIWPPSVCCSDLLRLSPLESGDCRTYVFAKRPTFPFLYCFMFWFLRTGYTSSSLFPPKAALHPTAGTYVCLWLTFIKQNLNKWLT